MDKDRIEGKVDDIKGRVKRQVGEWTGDEKAQAEGTMDQAKGKVQNTWGKVKDAARESLDDQNEQGKEGRVKKEDVA
ncbi:MAG: CsbD family protein [Terriglobales bacterium]